MITLNYRLVHTYHVGIVPMREYFPGTFPTKAAALAAAPDATWRPILNVPTIETTGYLFYEEGEPYIPQTRNDPGEPGTPPTIQWQVTLDSDPYLILELPELLAADDISTPDENPEGTLSIGNINILGKRFAASLVMYNTLQALLDDRTTRANLQPHMHEMIETALAYAENGHPNSTEAN